MHTYRIRLATIILIVGSSLSVVTHAATKAERQSIYQASKAGNHNDAFSMAQTLAKTGDKWAQKMLGEYYRKGKGVEQDYVTARHWYEKAAKQGDVRSVARLGSFYYRGRGVTKDYSKAFKYYHAINAYVGKKDAWVLRRIGHMYLYGQGVDKNPAAATRWFLKAASMGDTTAQLHLSNQYYLGEGLPQSMPAWLWWLDKSVEGGNKKARTLMDEVASSNGKAAVRKLQRTELQRDAKSSLLSPFGLGLGKPLHKYSTIFESDTFPRYGEMLAYSHSVFVQPPAPLNDSSSAPEYDANQSYQAYLTPVSGTLYRVDALRTYKSPAVCKDSLERFVTQLSSGMPVKIMQNWSDTGEGSQRYVVMANAPNNAAGGYERESWKVNEFQSIIGLSDTHPSAVIATMTCSDVNQGESLLSFVHLPSLEYRVAESFQADPFLASYFAQPPEAATKRSSLLSPFGIPLTEVLQNEVRQSSQVKDNYVSHTVKPPLANALFSEYTVNGSHISERVQSVFAAGHFKDKQVCWQSINKALLSLGNATEVNVPDWLSSGVFNGNDLNTQFIVGSDKNIKASVEVSAGCTDGRYEVNGQPGKWYGWARFSSDYANNIVDLEACVLNPERSLCEYSMRDDRELGMGEFQKLTAEF